MNSGYRWISREGIRVVTAHKGVTGNFCGHRKSNVCRLLLVVITLKAYCTLEYQIIGGGFEIIGGLENSRKVNKWGGS